METGWFPKIKMWKPALGQSGLVGAGFFLLLAVLIESFERALSVCSFRNCPFGVWKMGLRWVMTKCWLCPSRAAFAVALIFLSLLSFRSCPGLWILDFYLDRAVLAGKLVFGLESEVQWHNLF